MATVPPSQHPRITWHILPLSPVAYATLPRGKLVGTEALCWTLLPYFCLYLSFYYYILTWVCFLWYFSSTFLNLCNIFVMLSPSVCCLHTSNMASLSLFTLCFLFVVCLDIGNYICAAGPFLLTFMHTHTLSLCCARLFGRSRNEMAKFVLLVTWEKVIGVTEKQR